MYNVYCIYLSATLSAGEVLIKEMDGWMLDID